MRRYLAAAVIAFCAYNPAYAEEDVDTILNAYDSGNATQRQVIETVLDATANGFSWANAYIIGTRKETGIFCVPSDQKATDVGAEIIAKLRRLASADPKVGKMQYGFAMLIVLRRSFPCGPNSN